MKDEDQKLISRTPIARNTDPSSSHEAASKITNTGSRATQQGKILAGLQRHASKDFPITSAELARRIGIDRYVAARRLPEMRGVVVANGLQRKCQVTGNSAITWYALVAQPEAA